jgi:5'-methylthioadenosine phosphorylase
MILGVLGGSGLYNLDGLAEVRLDEVATPFGAPSAPVASGTLGGTRLLFLPRHGRGHRFSPSEINYRANVFALKTLGAERVLSVSAVGSLREGLAPGDFVLPDQFIDRTWGRASTFFGDGVVGHVGFADPTCAAFTGAVAAAAAAVPGGKRPRRGGTYVCMEGPQFSTRAESQLHRTWGADIIGMTGATEAKLCREAELCFASLALVTDYDAWHAEEAPVSVEAVIAVLRANVAGAQEIIRRLGEHIANAAPCGCARAAAHAVITAPDAISAEARGRLRQLLGRDP